MTLLGTVDICGHSVSVHLVTAEEMTLLDSDNPEGLTLVEKGVIYLRDDTTKDRLRDAFYHEVGHYFCDASGLSHLLMAATTAEDYGKFEEQLIRHATPWFVMLERSVGEFVKRFQ